MTLGESFELIVFAVLAVVLIFTAIMVVASKEIVHSALYLLGAYVLSNAAFVGIVQIFVYIGAIGILIIFAVMLTTREVGG